MGDPSNQVICFLWWVPFFFALLELLLLPHVGYVRSVYMTADPVVSAHSLVFPWRIMTTARDVRVTCWMKHNDNHDDSAALAVESNLSKNRTISIPRKMSACSEKGFTWSLPVAIWRINKKSRDCHVTLPFGDSFTKCHSKNVVWVSGFSPGKK